MRCVAFLLFNFISLSSCIEQGLIEKNYEQVALDYLLESQLLDSIERSVMFDQFFSSFSNDKHLYSDNRTCGLTMIGYAEDIRNYQSFEKDFLMKRDKVNSKDIKIPDFITNLSWIEFKSNRNSYQGYYLFVRNEITNGSEHLVQVSLIDGEILENSIDFIFVISKKGMVNGYSFSFNTAYYLEDNKCNE